MVVDISSYAEPHSGRMVSARETVQGATRGFFNGGIVSMANTADSKPAEWGSKPHTLATLWRTI